MAILYEKTVDGNTVTFTQKDVDAGANVIANPEAEATETLEKVQIDETVYDIPKLTQEQENTLATALKTPVATPTEIQLVAVDTNNAQTMLDVGDGLTVEDGVIKAVNEGYTLDLGAQTDVINTGGTISEDEFNNLVNNFPNCQVTLRNGGVRHTFAASLISDDKTILYFDSPDGFRTLLLTSFTGTYKWKLEESQLATTSTTQTISGLKTFTGTVDFTNATVRGLSSGLTEQEVQALIDTAINGALEGNY